MLVIARVAAAEGRQVVDSWAVETRLSLGLDDMGDGGVLALAIALGEQLHGHGLAAGGAVPGEQRGAGAGGVDGVDVHRDGKVGAEGSGGRVDGQGGDAGALALAGVAGTGAQLGAHVERGEVSLQETMRKDQGTMGRRRR